ncbi:ankyrin repeat and SOCS box protein 2-like, partial [Clarias magur]
DLDPFLSAIWNGDAKALSAIIQTKSRSVLKTNQEGWLPLHDSAYYGHVDCLKILLSAQPETINRRTLKNQTPLLLAVSRRHSACVYYLLEKGADPNLANHQWETPLYKACEKGTEEAVGLLIRYGALTNKASIQGATPLHEAVASKNVEMCKLLLQAKAILMAKNIYGIDPTFTAAQCGAAEVLRFLLMKGADVNTQANDGASALFEASKNGHSEVVEILLANHAQVNKSNKAGLFPIHVAAKNGHYRVVSLLIPRTDRTKIKHCGISPLHLAAERNRDEVLEILIDAGFDVNSTLSEDWSKMYEDHRKTALYCAVSNSNVDAAAMLLEAGADPNLDTFNPLLVAVRKGCIEMVKLLVNHGANINSILPTHPTEFPAALIFSMNNLPMIKYLMDYGCDAQSCFKCDYGSGTHPPIKSSMRDGRDRLYYLNDESSESCVQFCEMIARPKVTNWAGPIIDILLDYVGHVKLCSRLIEHLDTYSEWAQIKEKAKEVKKIMEKEMKLHSIMAAAVLGATGPTLNHDDFCLYGYMSDEELIQLAIERSLTETHNNSTPPSAESTKSSIPQHRPETPRPSPRQTPRSDPPPCPANPPREQNDQQPVTVSHFTTGSGKRMVAYRRSDGTLMEVKPEAEEKVDPVVRAIRNGEVGMLRGLIKMPDCNLLMPNEYGWIPLHEAAHYGQDHCVKALLR